MQIMDCGLRCSIWRPKLSFLLMPLVEYVTAKNTAFYLKISRTGKPTLQLNENECNWHGFSRCGICDDYATDPTRRHPINLALDDSNRWWQSPALIYGSEFEYVTVTVDLKQVCFCWKLHIGGNLLGNLWKYVNYYRQIQ